MDLHRLWSRLTGSRPDASSSDAPSGSTLPAVAGRPPAWRTLPPIAPTAHAAPLVAQRSPFEPGLGGAAPTPLALAPLGHERSLEAPAGLVTAVHAPVVARVADPVPASVRPPGRGRRPAGEAPATPRWPADQAEPAPAAHVEASELVAPPPARPAPVVARSATVAPLTVAPAVDAPGGFIGATPSAPAPVPASTRGAGPDEPGVPATSAVLPATESEPPPGPFPAVPVLPDLAVARSVTDRAPGSAQAGPLVARHNLGQSRRLRIGPAIEPIARPAAAGGLRPTMQRAVESTPDPMPQLPPDLPVERTVDPTTEAASAGLTVARSHGSPAGADAGKEAEHVHAMIRSDPDAAPAEAGAASDLVPVRPLGGDRPPIAPLLGTLRPTLDPASPAVAIARTRDDDEGEAAPAGVAAALAALNAPGGLPAPEASPTIARLADAASGGSASRGGPYAGGGGGPSGVGGGRGGRPGDVVGRSGSAPAGGPSGVGRLPAAAPGVPFVARSVAGTARADPIASAVPARPIGGAAAAPVGGTARLRVGAAVARFVSPSSAADGYSLPSTVAAGPPVAPSAGDASPATVLRAIADSDQQVSGEEPVAFGAAIQAAGVQRATDSSAAPANPATGGAPGAAGGPASGPELDALAARLYDRIRLRLRRELLADRERAGVLVDMGQ